MNWYAFVWIAILVALYVMWTVHSFMQKKKEELTWKEWVDDEDGFGWIIGNVCIIFLSSLIYFFIKYLFFT